MKVKVEKSFTGYPKGAPVDFAKNDTVVLTADYVADAKLVEKGLVALVEEPPTEI